MNPFKQLAGQTAVYGLSSIIGRILGYLLVPLYTYNMGKELYGQVIDIYVYIAFLLVVLTYGMETTFFRYSEKTGKMNKVFSTAFYSILGTSLIFLLAVVVFKQPLANLAKYETFPEYIIMAGVILFFDAINAIPYARLRLENRAKKFVVIRLTGIFLNIGLNLFFVLLLPKIYEQIDGALHEFITLFYTGEKVDLIKFIIFSNVVSSVVQTILFIPYWTKLKFEFDFALWKKMIVYASPLLVFGLAGIINEMLDRQMLKYMLSKSNSHEYAMSQIGIYGAVYKVSILMTIFIQAYRYAAEPFFFKQEKEKDSAQVYAKLMTYFVILTSIIFLGTMLYMDVIIYFVGEEYRVGRDVIPILLLANLFLGIIYNLSIWYKLTNRTQWGMYLALFGAAITVGLNWYWIPRIGYVGSAWATLICYGSMMIVSFVLGRKFYKLPYDYLRLAFYITLSVGMWWLSEQIAYDNQAVKYIVNSLILFAFLGIVWLVDGLRVYKSLKR